MSVVAGKVYGNRIVMAADTQVTRNQHIKEDCNKVWKVGDLMIGAVGTASEAQLMRLFLDTHKPKSTNEHDVVEFMVEFYAYCRSKTKDWTPYNGWLLAFGGKLLDVTCDLAIFYREHAAIGSGSDYAKAAMYLGKSPEEAVGVACDLTIYCGKPIEVHELWKDA